MRRYITINEKWMGWRGRTWKCVWRRNIKRKKLSKISFSSLKFQKFYFRP